MYSTDLFTSSCRLQVIKLLNNSFHPDYYRKINYCNVILITCNELLTCLLHPVYNMFTNYCTALYIQLITGTKELLTSLFHLVDYTWTHSRPVYFILLITGKHTPDLFISSSDTGLHTTDMLTLLHLLDYRETY